MGQGEGEGPPGRGKGTQCWELGPDVQSSWKCRLCRSYTQGGHETDALLPFSSASLLLGKFGSLGLARCPAAGGRSGAAVLGAEPAHPSSVASAGAWPSPHPLDGAAIPTTSNCWRTPKCELPWGPVAPTRWRQEAGVEPPAKGPGVTKGKKMAQL